jgi:hypothetical protein
MACLIGVAAQSKAWSAEPKVIGSYKNWSAHTFKEAKGPVCYLHGVPSRSVGKYTKRGDIYLQVTHRPAAKTKNEVSITAGYAHKKGSEVNATIDGKTFVLFTEGDTAWAGDEKADAALVAAMRAGRLMVVRGISARGTKTSDTYSLAGFTAAHKAINKACGKK